MCRWWVVSAWLCRWVRFLSVLQSLNMLPVTCILFWLNTYSAYNSFLSLLSLWKGLGEELVLKYVSRWQVCHPSAWKMGLQWMDSLEVSVRTWHGGESWSWPVAPPIFSSTCQGPRAHVGKPHPHVSLFPLLPSLSPMNTCPLSPLRAAGAPTNAMHPPCRGHSGVPGAWNAVWYCGQGLRPWKHLALEKGSTREGWECHCL